MRNGDLGVDNQQETLNRLAQILDESQANPGLHQRIEEEAKRISAKRIGEKPFGYTSTQEEMINDWESAERRVIAGLDRQEEVSIFSRVMSVFVGKPERDKTLEELADLLDSNVLLNIALNLLESGKMNITEKLFDYLHITQAYTPIATDSTNEFHTFSDRGDLPGLILKRYLFSGSSEVEFGAYRKIAETNELILRSLKKNSVKIALDVYREGGDLDETYEGNGMSYRDILYYSSLPEIKVPNLKPDVDTGISMKKYILMENVGLLSDLEQESSLTLFNILRLLNNQVRKDECPDEFLDSFRLLSEFKKNTFLAYLQKNPLEIRPESIVHTDFDKNLDANTTALMEYFEGDFSDEDKSYVAKPSSIFSQGLKNNRFVQARDTTPRNIMFRPHDFNEETNLETFVEDAKKEWEQGEGRLKRLIGKTIRQIDFDKLHRFTHECEDQRNDVEGVSHLPDQEQMISDYHFLLQQTRFDLLEGFRKGEVEYSKIKEANKLIRDVELGRNNLSCNDEIGVVEDFIKQSGVFQYESFEDYFNDLACMSIYRNSRTARHIVREYIPNTKDDESRADHMEGLRHHILETRDSLVELVDRLQSITLPDEQYLPLFDSRMDYSEEDLIQQGITYMDMLDKIPEDNNELLYLAKLQYNRAVYSRLLILAEKDIANGKQN